MIACLVLLAAALSVGNDEFDRSAAEGAARITFARVRREIVADGPSGGVLRQAMLAEPTRFRTRAEAVSGDFWAEDPACYLTDGELGLA